LLEFFFGDQVPRVIQPSLEIDQIIYYSAHQLHLQIISRNKNNILKYSYIPAILELTSACNFSNQRGSTPQSSAYFL